MDVSRLYLYIIILKDMRTVQKERDEKFYSSVDTWKRAYMVTLDSIPKLKLRLLELTTWDKAGSETERNAKITALSILIYKLENK